MPKLLAEVNISEGTNLDLIEQIKDSLLLDGKVTLIDLNSDKNHNRTVFTYYGEPFDVLESTKRLSKTAIDLIDMTKHKGSHPRLGAVDVVPFVPIKDVTIEDAKKIAKKFGEYLGSIGVPVYYYEECATAPYRKSLVDIRRGEYENLKEKMLQEEWKPDEGPLTFISKSGATVTGVRFPLVAFNVNLKTDNLEIAKKIVRSVRFSTGGYKSVRAIALKIEEKNIVQVSMNLINYKETPIHRVFETIKSECFSYGVLIDSCELVGPVPLEAFEDVLKHYLMVHDFSMEQIY